jgi:hypothetical protein
METFVGISACCMLAFGLKDMLEGVLSDNVGEILSGNMSLLIGMLFGFAYLIFKE